MNIHDLDWPSLQNDFLSKENSMKRLIFANSFLKFGKDLIKREWAEKMVEEQKHILFFDYFESIKLGVLNISNVLNVVKKPFVLAKDKTVVKASHPPIETLRVKGKDDIVVIASPFKVTKNDTTHSETRKLLNKTILLINLFTLLVNNLIVLKKMLIPTKLLKNLFLWLLRKMLKNL
jgi:hypothetical protein